jgi:predicted dehydrogenase
MTNATSTLAIVGCGNIAGNYLKSQAAYPQNRIVGFFDLDRGRAEQFAAEHGGKAYGSLDDVLADAEVQVVLNLTIHHAHYQVIKACLNAGKHVFSEKPMTLAGHEAHELVRLADERNLRLGAAPSNFLGESQQTAAAVLRSGVLGRVRVIYAEVNHGRIETWHPNPEPFYQVGPLFDVGVYPLTVIVSMLGPARRVLAYGSTLYPDRVTKEGRSFTVSSPDFMCAMITLADGTLLRLTTNFYVGSHNRQGSGIEFHGDQGSLHLKQWARFDAPVAIAEFKGEYKDVPLCREPFAGVEYPRGLVEMIEAINDQRPHRATGAMAAHVVDILCAVQRSAHEGRAVSIDSEFARPEPMPWAEAGIPALES